MILTRLLGLGPRDTPAASSQIGSASEVGSPTMRPTTCREKAAATPRLPATLGGDHQPDGAAAELADLAVAVAEWRCGYVRQLVAKSGAVFSNGEVRAPPCAVL